MLRVLAADGIICLLLSSSFANVGPLAGLLGVVKLPLVPVVVCLDLGIGGSLSWLEVAALLAQVGYFVGLVLFAQWQLGRRDLLLH